MTATEVVTQTDDSNWVIGAAADFNRDGWPDLSFENLMTGATAAWEMEGLKIGDQYPATQPSPATRGWHIVGPS